jgi:hypothetical protein
MIWTQDDVDNLIRNVAPPGEVPKGYSDKISFIDALAIALSKWAGEDNTPLLEGLRKKYPEAVEAYMQEAERMAQETNSAVPA